MNTLLLGLAAALCWGFHDICVRYLSQKTPLSACIFIVILSGLAFHIGLMGINGEHHALPAKAVWLSAGAGVFFIIATFGLYLAFQRGPVRLVAPLIAAYPIVSVGLAAAQGTPISPLHWGAVFAIVIGVALVAALSDTSTDDSPPIGRTVIYALIAALGFAGTFALGQYAADISHEMPATLVTRIVALALVVIVLLAFKLPFLAGKPRAAAFDRNGCSRWDRAVLCTFGRRPAQSAVRCCNVIHVRVTDDLVGVGFSEGTHDAAAMDRVHHCILWCWCPRALIPSSCGK